MSVKVKICGITTAEDALAAVGAGADALGFIFYERSPRYIPHKTAARIISQLPPFVAKVGVFVNASAEQVRQAIESCGIDTLQFHGDESVAFCASFNMAAIRAFRIQDAESLRVLPAFKTAAWLLDSFVSGKEGGSGKKFNWDLAVQAKQLGRPIILAGGLTPQNVAEAVRTVQPYGVDVSSGVETSAGKKDHAKVQAFVAAAHSTVHR